MTPATALLYAGLTCVVILFQLALAAGAPWGQAAMGGRFRGRFPSWLRALAIVQAAVLAMLATIVLIRGGLVLPELFELSTRWIWVPVVFGVLGAIANLSTPSRIERAIWGPTAVVLLACSLWLALYAPS